MREATEHVGRKALELPRCSLLHLNGDRKGDQSIVNSDHFRIGKATENTLVLKDDTVSRFHCEIVHETKGFLLRDLESTNGTLLDGAEVREAYLTPGAVITVGTVELKVRPYEERIDLVPSDATSFGEVIGETVRMREIFGLLEQLAPTEATVLIGGETGTGKDLLARAIHDASPRKKKPYIVVDCGAVVSTLIESELFGHEKGAFTGADTKRQGAFELASGGTLFLDEIGELPLDMQPKLLRVLEQRSFRRVGGTTEVRVDIRIIAASKRNLKLEVERGKFREDLYFRLAVVPIELPPLRDRRKDIPSIAETLLRRIDTGEQRPSLATGVLDSLVAHDWPGNVRELRNLLERAAYMACASGQSTIDFSAFPVALGATSKPDPVWDFTPAESYRDTKTRWEQTFEREYVHWLLKRHEGNISAAAREADMDRKYLHKLVKKYGL